MKKIVYGALALLLATPSVSYAQSIFGGTNFNSVVIDGSHTPGSRDGNCVNSFLVMRSRSEEGDGSRDEVVYNYFWMGRDRIMRVASTGAFPDEASPNATSPQIRLDVCVTMDDASGPPVIGTVQIP